MLSKFQLSKTKNNNNNKKKPTMNLTFDLNICSQLYSNYLFFQDVKICILGWKCIPVFPINFFTKYRNTVLIGMSAIYMVEIVSVYRKEGKRHISELNPTLRMDLMSL